MNKNIININSGLVGYAYRTNKSLYLTSVSTSSYYNETIDLITTNDSLAIILIKNLANHIIGIIQCPFKISSYENEESFKKLLHLYSKQLAYLIIDII